MTRTLIEGGFAVPMTARAAVIENGIVAFEDDRLVHVGGADGFDRDAFDADFVLSARGKAVLPGLVNTHVHLIGAYLKGITEDVPGKTAGLFNRALPILAQCRDPRDVYVACLAHAMETAMTGTATLVKHLAPGDERGRRGSRPRDPRESPRESQRDARRDRLHRTEGMARSRELADRLRIGINVHIAEVPGETEFGRRLYGKRPIEIGAETGVLGPETIHVAKRGYCPPREKIYAANVPVSLGSDWCSNDLWKYMRAAVLIPRTTTGPVGMLSGYDALEMATMGGARSLGMEAEIGSLEAGKKADVIVVDMMRPWLMPTRVENLVSNLVYNVNGSDVTDVFVDGRPIVRDRECVTVDRVAVLEELQGRARRIWSEAEKHF